ncbi:hypothetical protein BUALT_Bualt12G0020200 [Buddleja alternifolia]|uniref:Glycosyltransferase N-terminal domain-containing protein n=1 Tax=Buddleja alternifolia TaxID=168488 RepID=A0AAV6WSV0_9LAMI|nr:hypothetical protein BUALT_Bualt12G0020200 [Buddleja alternifolia]
MGSLTNHQSITTNEEDQVIVIMVPFPAQGHLNQLLQLSCLVSSHNIPVHYVGSAIHNCQAKTRANALNPNDVAKIHFHDFPIPPFASPPPNPKSSHKFPTQLQPAWNAAWTLQRPIADYTLEMSARAKRVVVIHDPLMATVVQDVASIPKCELYAFIVYLHSHGPPSVAKKWAKRSLWNGNCPLL